MQGHERACQSSSKPSETQIAHFTNLTFQFKSDVREFNCFKNNKPGLLKIALLFKYSCFQTCNDVHFATYLGAALFLYTPVYVYALTTHSINHFDPNESYVFEIIDFYM